MLLTLLPYSREKCFDRQWYDRPTDTASNCKETKCKLTSSQEPVADHGEEGREHGAAGDASEDALTDEDLSKCTAFSDHECGEEEDKVCGHEREAKVASVNETTGEEARDED